MSVWNIAVWVRIPLYKVYSCLYSLLNKGFYVKPCNDKLHSLDSNCRTKVLSALVIGGGLLRSDKELPQFFQWFVGFRDAEAGFLLQPVLSSDNTIKKIT